MKISAIVYSAYSEYDFGENVIAATVFAEQCSRHIFTDVDSLTTTKVKITYTRDEEDVTSESK